MAEHSASRSAPVPGVLRGVPMGCWGWEPLLPGLSLFGEEPRAGWCCSWVTLVRGVWNEAWGEVAKSLRGWVSAKVETGEVGWGRAGWLRHDS